MVVVLHEEKKQLKNQENILMKYIIVGNGFEHYSYEMSEFKPNKSDTMNL